MIQPQKSQTKIKLQNIKMIIGAKCAANKKVNYNENTCPARTLQHFK